MESKPKIMLLGTIHLAQTDDMHNLEISQLDSLNRQKELKRIVNKIKEFNPTKIAVEVDTKENELLNERYHNYITNKSPLQMNEIDQIAFRLGEILNHKILFGIDWMEKGAGKRGYTDVYNWAKESQPELFQQIFSPPNLNGTKSIRIMLMEVNSSKYQKKDHWSYINMARIGTTHEHVGLDWLIWWYQRNLILFSNLTRITTSPTDRVFLLIGAAHLHLLYQFLEDSEYCDLISPLSYLE
ncbi:DUF5694 domain-containing protein [Falsibacillus albus]|uniref:TraB/GumN family protein n=1 Tax=Falsibacillus albus TaxID=2478915 RepID=A0A3L7JZQ6_9BACI|nr:DUF5694 domain-containing protein [Falsibacillus albus]RLQ96267.1 hypothetical protein D9X91_08250 [Falsibacillus albus]